MKTFYKLSAFLLILGFSLLNINSSYSQCSYTGVVDFTSAAPAVIGNTVASGSITSSHSYRITGMVSGNTYRVYNCGSGFDTQISVYAAGGGGSLAYNDDNGPECAGAASSLTFTAPASGDYDMQLNRYNCQGTGGGSIGAVSVRLLSVAVVIPNDNCANAIPITCGQTVNGSTVGANADQSPLGCVTGTGANVWYSINVATTSNVTLSLCGSGFDTGLGVFSGSCGSLTSVACNDDFCGLQSQLTFTAIAGTTYLIDVTGYNGNSGAFTLAATCVVAAPPPPNDDCSSVSAVTLINGVPTVFSGNSVGVTMGPGEANLGLPTVWHKITTTTCTNLTLDYCGTSPAFADVYVVMVTACPVGSSADYFFANNWQQNCAGGGSNWTMNYNNLAAGTYWIPVIGDEPGSVTPGPYTFTATAVACAATPPNDLCTSVVPTPVTIGVPQTFTGNTVGATPDGAFFLPTVWHAIILPSCATITLDYCATSPEHADTWINLASDCAFSTIYTANSFTQSCPGGGNNWILTFNNMPAGTYYIPVLGDEPGFNVAGPYSLTVTTVACPAAPPNDQCGGALPFVVIPQGTTHTFTGTTVGATDVGDGLLVGNGALAVWGAFTVPASNCATSTVTISYCGNTQGMFTNSFYAWITTLCPITATNIGIDFFHPDYTGGNYAWDCADLNPHSTMTGIPPGNYYFPIYASGSPQGPYSVDVTVSPCLPPPANDDCANAIPVTCGSSVSGQTESASHDGLDVTCGGGPFGAPDGPNVWYSYTNAQSGLITLSLCSGTTYDAVMAVYTGTCAGGLTEVACDDDGCGIFAGPSTVTFTAAANTTYLINVSGYFGASGPFTLNTSCVLCAQEPVGGTASAAGVNAPLCTNSQINFTLTGYTGTSIQWQVSSDGGSTWADILGGTSDNLFYAFPAQGNWRIRARLTSAGCGNAFSNELLYTVSLDAPSVVPTATPNPVCPGAQLNLGIAACAVPTGYSVSTIPFATVPGSGTNVTLGDDQLSGSLPIGFPFGFYGNTYNDFYISSNGFISFDGGAYNGCCSGQLLPDGSSPNNVIAPAWEDYYPPAGGTISYFTTGATPNQMLVVNFTNILHYPGTGTPVTMQIVLHECSGDIDFNITNMTSDGGNHTQGVENSGGTSAVTTPGRNASSWTAINDSKRYSGGGGGGGFTSYAWSGPGGYVGSGATPAPIASMLPANFGTFLAVGTYPNGCLVNGYIDVTALPSPVPDASSSTPVCDGTTLQLFGDNFGVGQALGNSYSWTGPNGYGPVAGQNPTLNPTVAGTGNYIVTVTNSLGCTETASTAVVVNPNPTLAVASVTNAICQGDMNGCIDIDASAAAAPYLYDYNGNSTVDGIYCGLGAGTYTVTVSDDNNCSSSIQATVIEQDLIPPTISTCPATYTIAANPLVCYATFPESNLGSPVAFDNCPVPGGVYGNGINQIDNNVTNATQYPVGGTFVQWDVYDLSANKTSCQQLVIVQDLEPPVALCKNICIYLGSDGLATITGADINNGSHDNCGIASLTASPSSFSYADAGPNTVTLTVLDVNGNSSTCTATVTVGEYYTLFGAGPTCSTPAGQSDVCHVNIGNGNTVNGNVGSYRQISTGGGVVINGNVYSGGKVNYANGVASKSVSAANLLGVSGLIFQTGNSADITGDVNVTGNININQNGGSFVTGTVRHPSGTTYAGPVPGGGVLTAAPVLPVLPGMPTITSYSCGGANITTTATLNPGSYGNITLGNPAGVIITFHGPGNYYFSSIKMGQGGIHTFKYDFLGLPGKINIYVCGDIDFGDYEALWANPNTPDACRVYFETHGTGSTNGTNSTYAAIIALGSHFYGRIWAPYGGIHIGSGSCCTYATGSFWSAKQVHLEGAVTINRCGSTCPPGPRIGQEEGTIVETKDMLQVYPNPTTGQTTVSFFTETPDNYSLKVMDYQGRVVLSNEIKSIAGDNTVEVDMSQFAKGLYLIEVGNHDHSQKVKLVVQ